MQYVLVNKYDEIVTSVDLASEVGVNGATTYFQGIKQMPDREAFLKLWKVMTRDDYNIQFKVGLQNRQMGKMKYEWWKEDQEETDEMLKGKDGLG